MGHGDTTPIEYSDMAAARRMCCVFAARAAICPAMRLCEAAHACMHAMHGRAHSFQEDKLMHAYHFVPGKKGPGPADRWSLQD